jgi:hypothetical protein
MSDDQENTTGKMKRMMDAGAAQDARDRAAERERMRRTMEPVPVTRTTPKPSTRIVQVGRGARR